MVNRLAVATSSQEMVNAINNGSILKFGDENYLIYTYIPPRIGYNPLTGEEILLKEKKSPKFYNRFIIHNLEEYLSENNFLIFSIPLPKIENYPVILETHDGIQIGTLSKSSVHNREIQGISRAEISVVLITCSKDFEKILLQQIKISYIINKFSVESLKGEEEIKSVEIYK